MTARGHTRNYTTLTDVIGRCAITRPAIAPQTEDQTGYCTCFLVSGDVIMTAQHCVDQDFQTRPEGTDRPRVRTIFRLGVSGHPDTSIAERLVLRVVAKGAGSPGSRPDWITLRLREPISDARPLPLRLKPVDKNTPLTIIHYGVLPGYHISLIPSQTITPCRITRLREASIRHDCPLPPGASGAPVLAQTETGWEVVGLTTTLGLPAPRSTDPMAGFSHFAGVTQAAYSQAVTINPAMLVDLDRASAQPTH